MAVTVIFLMESFFNALSSNCKPIIKLIVYNYYSGSRPACQDNHKSFKAISSIFSISPFG